MRSRIWLGIGLVVVAPTLLAAERLNVRTGLWEITSVTQFSGMPPLPKDMLDKMTPQQRKEMEAAMKSAQAGGPETNTDRECITDKDLEVPFQSPEDKNCTQTIVNTTRTSQEVRLVCTGEHAGTGVLRVSTPTPTTMTADLDLRTSSGKDEMTIKSQMKGRWLGADCGDLADDEDSAADDDEDSSDE